MQVTKMYPCLQNITHTTQGKTRIKYIMFFTSNYPVSQPLCYAQPACFCIVTGAVARYLNRSPNRLRGSSVIPYQLMACQQQYLHLKMRTCFAGRLSPKRRTGSAECVRT